MRIAFVSTVFAYPFGGADRLWSDAVEAALSASHDVLLAVSPLTARHPIVCQFAERGARVHLRQRTTDCRGRIDEWKQLLQDVVRSRSSLLAALNRFSPDIVVVSQGGTYDLLLEPRLMQWLTSRQVPYVVISQSNGESERLTDQTRETARRIMLAAAANVFVSTQNLRLAEQQLGVSLGNAVRIQNPVSTKYATPLPWPEMSASRLAAVARLESDKGLHLLLDALATIGRRFGEWTLDIFGQGGEEGALREQTARLGLAGNVSFRGFVDGIESVWRTHHLLVLPSLREGCSLAMLEALASGRPVLATDVGGVADWINDGVNGFISPDATSASLANMLERAFARRSEWRTIGTAAFETSQRFDPRPGDTLLNLIISTEARRSRALHR